MVTLDSNKIEAPISVLRYFNQDKAVQSIQQKEGEVLSDKYAINGISPGFNYFEVNTKKQTVILGTSAKILKDDYLKGINKNSIEQVLDEVNRQGKGILEVDPFEVVNEGRFLSVDATNNLEIDLHPLKYLDALHSYKVNTRYKVDYNNTKDNQGIVFSGIQKSFKERLIIYNKFIELTNKHENRPFLESVKNVPRLLNTCKSILRVESNNVQLRKIRERFNIPNTGVLNVLESPSNPNYNLVMKIVKGSEQLSLFDELDGFKSFNQFEKFKGQQTIIRECNFDLEFIEQLMRHFFSEKTNISKQKKEYRGLIYSMMEQERIEKSGEPGLVERVLELLKAC